MPIYQGSGTGVNVWEEPREVVIVPITHYASSYQKELKNWEDWLTQKAYLITHIPWSAYSGLSMPIIILSNPPTVNFKLAITLSSVTGHTDCMGTVIVGPETLTYTMAGRKLTTTSFTAFPTIMTSANIDCHIEIVCVDNVGNVLQKETKIPLDCRWVNKVLWFQGTGGIWENTTASMFIKGEIDAGIGSEIQFDISNPLDPVDGRTYICKNLNFSTNEWGATIIRRLDF